MFIGTVFEKLPHIGIGLEAVSLGKLVSAYACNECATSDLHTSLHDGDFLHAHTDGILQLAALLGALTVLELQGNACLGFGVFAYGLALLT